nr:MAG TPA_asm: hypothetical protein [Caudoviricetes sp.]
MRSGWVITRLKALSFTVWAIIPALLRATARYSVKCTALMPQPLRSWMRFAPKGESTNVF